MRASAEPLYGDGIESHLHFGGGTQGRQVCLYPHGAPPGGGGGEQLTERVGGRDRRAD